MLSMHFRRLFRSTSIVAASVALLAATTPTDAATFTLRDGRSLSGRSSPIAGVAEDPLNPRINPGGVDISPILVIDDDLRRTYVPRRRITNIDPVDPPLVKISVRQNVASSGAAIGGIGPVLRITSFDEFGRRVFSMNTPAGPVEIVQGITTITPNYTKVEGLIGPRRPVVWDMRLATSSIPSDTLAAVLKHAVPQTDPQARLSVVRLYLQSERYRDARLELEQIVKDFPDIKGLDKEVRELRQMGARRALKEIQLRADAGQHQFSQKMLTNFPAEEVAGETLQQVREMLAEYDARQRKLDKAKTLLSKVVSGIGNAAVREQTATIVKEITTELNFSTLARMAPLLQLGDDKDLSPEDKASLAITGWLLGTNNASDNLPVALSLVEVRDHVREYLRESVKPRRDQILNYLRTKEGASVEQIANMLLILKPPLDLPPLVDETVYGYFEHRIPGLNEHPDVRYLVQLPPEYDPHRRYPTIVTLNGAGSTPELQLEFWAGSVVRKEAGSSGEKVGDRGRDEREMSAGIRMGQGMRHGYITVAVDWRKPHQLEYKYSAREHYAVLSVLRDVCRRFAVDTDRVYLSGHDIGGDAAWDLALAHPDVWAGVMPVVATADRYCARYWRNAEYVPLYLIAGELDGTSMRDNARDLDNYLRHGYDTTVVEYRGRGHEIFGDEIQHLFDWMGRRRRDFFPKEFECRSMRRWDNYFWWLEVDDLPDRAMVEPEAWPPASGRRPMTLRGTITQANGINVRARGVGRTVVWLSPEMVDFGKRINVSIDGRRARGAQSDIHPNLATLLEDARSRADRQHPFWAKVESP